MVSFIGLLFLGLAYKIPTFQSLNKIGLYQMYGAKIIAAAIGIVLIAIALHALLRKKSFLNNNTKIKQALGNLIILGIVVLICIAILEVALRITASPHTGPQYMQKDPVLHHAQIPNTNLRFVRSEWDTTISVNEIGLRDDPLIDKTKTKLRILMLGDSYTWGFGVENHETFSQVLEKKFKQNGYDIDVINAGVVSYSPILEYLFVRERGLSLDPDIIILNLDLTDLRDDLSYEKLAVFDEHGNLQAVPGPQEDIIPFYDKLMMNVRTFGFITSTLDNIYARIPHKKEIQKPYARDINVNKLAVLRNDVTPHDLQEHWDRSFKYIHLTKKLADQNNISFILTTYPFANQHSTQEWKYGKHRFGFGNDILYDTTPQETITSFAHQNDITLLNMVPFFKQSNTYPLYFAFDGHFNQDGHKLVSDIFYNHLTKRQDVKAAQTT